MTVDEALDSIKTDLAKWKPNCALVMIDFALRHGFLDPDHEVRNASSCVISVLTVHAWPIPHGPPSH